MSETRRNFAVGLFVLASLTVAGTLMVWFGEVPDWIATSEWTLRIAGVRELSGVGDGTPVNLLGIQVGRVKSIEFRNPDDPDQGVVIVTRIKRQYSIPKGAQARVYGSTFGLGSGRIDILPRPGVPPEPLPKDDAVIGGEMRSAIGEVIKKEFVDSLERTVTHIGDLAAAAKPVMDNLRELLEKRPVEQVNQPLAAERGLTANLSTVVERIDQLVANVNAMLGDEHVQEDVKLAVRGLKQASEDLRATMDLWKTESRRLANNLNEGVDKTEANLDDTFLRLNQVLGHLDRAASDLATATLALTRNAGSAGLILHDPRLYESAVLALDRLGEVLLDIKSVTGKMREDGYITVGLAPGGFPQKRIPLPGTTNASSVQDHNGSVAFDRAIREATRGPVPESREPASLASFPP